MPMPFSPPRMQKLGPFARIILVYATVIVFFSLLIISGYCLIALPRTTAVSRQNPDPEYRLKSTQHGFRNAIKQFQDDTGLLPATLSDLTLPSSKPPQRGVVEGTNKSAVIPVGSYQGPYLNYPENIGSTGLPVNPMKNNNDADYTNVEKHWRYTPSTGSVVSAVSATTCTKN